MCTHTCMTTKTITIMEDAYDILVGNRESNERFCEVIRKLGTNAKKKRKLIELFGILSKEQTDIMRKDLEERRRYSDEHPNERRIQWKS